LCGSGGSTRKFLKGISPQFKSGGGGGMHTSGYDGSQFAAGAGAVSVGTTTSTVLVGTIGGAVGAGARVAEGCAVAAGAAVSVGGCKVGLADRGVAGGFGVNVITRSTTVAVATTVGAFN
jgi:hypothetical protein